MNNKKEYKIRINAKIWVMSLFVIIYPMTSFLSGILGSSIAKSIAIILLYLPLLFIVIIKRNTINVKCIILFIFTLSFVLISSNSHPEFNHVYHDELFGIFSGIITGYSSIFALIFWGLYCEEKDYKSILLYSAWLNMLMCLLKIFFTVRNSSSFTNFGYDMNLGYQLLFSILVFVSIAIRTHKKLYLILSISLLLLLLVFGSRGPLVCIMMFAVLYFIVIYRKKLSFKFRALFWVIITFFSCVMLIYYRYISPLLDFSAFSRTVRFILDPSSWYGHTDQSRQMILNKISEHIGENGILGNGILADQGYLGTGLYSHNIAYEMCLTFGPVIGILFLIILSFITLKILSSKRISEYEKKVTILFFSLSVGRLLVSYSFWYENNFWIFISVALCLLSKRTNNANI